ncbi:translational activator of GCN4, partial [Ascosphaera atra]
MAVLQAILSEMDLTDFDFSEHIWLERHDNALENCEIAEAIWEQNALDVEESSPASIIKYLRSQDSQLREAAARALAHACQLVPSTFESTIESLKDQYRDEVRPKPVEKDAYGMPKKVDHTDNWVPRSGIALAFRYMASGFQGDQIVRFMQFLIEEGPLIDNNALVRQQMSES